MRTAFVLFFSITSTTLLLAQSLSAALDVDALATEARETWDLPGLAISIVQDDTLLWSQGYGVKELGKDDPVNADTLFSIASNSKAFTSAIVASLVEEGLLEWNEPVKTYLPEFELNDPFLSAEVTVEDLLTHRVGIASANALWIRTPFTRDEILQRLHLIPTINSLRNGYHYNNNLYIVAGLVARAVTGQTWDELIQQRIFTPLGMENSCTSIRHLPRFEHTATPHADNPEGTVIPIPRYNADNCGPAGSILSCVNDMANWMRCLLAQGEFGGEPVLAESVIRQMQTPHTLIPVSRSFREMIPDAMFRAYGLGHRIHNSNGLKFVEHSGGLNGFRSYVLLVPEKNLGVCVLTNSYTNASEAVAKTIADTMLGIEGRDWYTHYGDLFRASRERSQERLQERDDERIPDTTPSLEPVAYTGTFSHPAYGEIHISLEDETLHFVKNEAALVMGSLRHWHHDTFMTEPALAYDSGDLYVFHLDADGQIEAVTDEGWGIRYDKQ